MRIGNTKYRIIADEVSITLQEEYEIKSGKNKGNKDYRNLGYYSNASSVFKALVDLEVKRTELSDFATIITKINEVKNIIDNMDFSEIEIRRSGKVDK